MLLHIRLMDFSLIGNSKNSSMQCLFPGIRITRMKNMHAHLLGTLFRTILKPATFGVCILKFLSYIAYNNLLT